MMNEKTLREKIQVLIDNRNLSDHYISLDTGLTLSSVQRIRNGVAKLDNVTLRTAEKLAEYHDKVFPNN